MSRIAIPGTIDASPAASQPLLEAVKKQLGVLPNDVDGVAETDVDFPRVATRAEYDGLCAVAVSMGERVPADATSLSYHAGRSFRFSSAEAKAMFDAEPSTFIAKSDARWPLPG